VEHRVHTALVKVLGRVRLVPAVRDGRVVL
jgi:hypothetical protein